MKDELAVPAPPPVDALQGSVCMSPTYQDQVYYDLSMGAVVRSNEKEEWDLAFASDPNQGYMVLNAARLMRAAVTTEQQLSVITDTMALAGRFNIDVSSGNTDSLAVDLSQSSGNVIVLDMGYSHIGLHLGMYKLVVESYDASAYYLRYAPLQSIGQGSLITVDRDYSTTLVHASILNDQQVAIEPEKGAFDLLFTQYTVYFEDPGTQYLVTGVLCAREGVRAARFDGLDFQSVQLNDTLMNPLSDAIDEIGYDWKEYDFDLSLFVTDPSIVYIVQGSSRAFYKLRFTDFYNGQGQKGCPQFEIIAF
jgi:hypothetical protein